MLVLIVVGKTFYVSFYCYPSSHLCLLWSDTVFAWPFHSATKTNGDRKKREHRWGLSVPGCAWSSSSSASYNYCREKACPLSVSAELTDSGQKTCSVALSESAESKSFQSTGLLLACCSFESVYLSLFRKTLNRWRWISVYV